MADNKYVIFMPVNSESHPMLKSHRPAPIRIFQSYFKHTLTKVNEPRKWNSWLLLLTICHRTAPWLTPPKTDMVCFIHPKYFFYLSSNIQFFMWNKSIITSLLFWYQIIEKKLRWNDIFLKFYFKNSPKMSKNNFCPQNSIFCINTFQALSPLHIFLKICPRH